MRHPLALFVVLAAVTWYPTTVYGQGSVIERSFYSASLDEIRSATVYLPEGYFVDPSAEYPVVYFLHGGGGTHLSYSVFHTVLDDLIGDQTIDPIIFVKPDGSKEPYGATWFANSELNGLFEDFVVFDLVEFVDQNYRTLADRGQRAIMGHSMGAVAAMQLALRHPDVFVGTAAIDGVMDFDFFIEIVPMVLEENEGPPYTFEPEAGVNTMAYFGVSSAYSPNLENEPYLVDFLLNEEGNIVDSTFAKWLLHDPIYLASTLSPSNDLAIFFSAGRQSLLLEANRTFDAFLDSEGWDYTYYEHGGGHNSSAPSDDAIVFLTSSMTAPVATETPAVPVRLILSSPAPNPTSAQTTLTYTLAEPAPVRLTVYDVLGREVAVLAEGTQAAGQHDVMLDASWLAPGLYVVHLTAGGETVTHRVTVVR